MTRWTPHALVLLSFIVGLSAIDVDGIIDEYWQRYQTDLHKRAAIAEPKGIVFESQKDFTGAYHCQHDRVSERMDIKGVRERGLRMALEDAHQESSAGSRPEVSWLGSNKRAAPTDRQDWKPIRMFLNTTRLNPTASSDPNRACTPGVTRVKFGYPTGSSTPVCSQDGQDDCWHPCNMNDVLDSSLRDLLENYALPAMQAIFSGMLRVSPVSGNLVLSREAYSATSSCYEDVPIDKSVVSGLGPGVPNADIYIYVTARPAPSTGTVAYALSCNWVYDTAAQSWGRTLAGLINFNPMYFRGVATSSFQFRSILRAAVHEVTHVFGFSSSQYSSYRDNDGLPYSTSPLYRFRKTFNGQTVDLQALQTPRVAQWAREHYNCPSLMYVELENYGSSGTAGSHWEKRVAGPEYMTGYINPQMPITALTMSLLEDTGFYAADYSFAEPLVWGLNQGCGFVNGRCENTWVNTGYFCTSSSVKTCSPEGDSYGSCNIGLYNSDLPRYYQHFTQANVGGSVAAADYCPYTSPDTGVGYCLDQSQPGRLGGTYGPNSTCFTVSVGGSPSPACFWHNCVDANTLQVKINGVIQTCPSAGGTFPTSGGTFQCPPAASICNPDAYLSSWPLVTGVSPSSAATTSGTTITITGSNFDSSRSYTVKVGSGSATNVNVASPTSITAKLSSHTCDGRIVDVSVIDNSNQNVGTLFASFTFEDCSFGSTLVPSLVLVLALLAAIAFGSA